MLEGAASRGRRGSVGVQFRHDEDGSAPRENDMSVCYRAPGSELWKGDGVCKPGLTGCRVDFLSLLGRRVRRGEERMRRSIQLKQSNLFATPDVTPQIFAAEMRIRLVYLLSALLLEAVSAQSPELTTAVEEQDSE